MLNYNLNLKNLSINVQEREGKKGTIIFIHGNSMSSKIWQKQMDSELFAEYRLLAIDLPGHGDSSYSTAPDDEYNVLFYGALLAEFISKTDVQNPILVGHSLGANVVIEALPLLKSCKACVLIAASLVHSAEEVSSTFLPNPSIPTFFKADYTDEDVQNFVTAISGKSGVSLPDFVAEDFRKTDKDFRACLAKSVGENKLSDELTILQNSEISILLAIGAEDQLCSLDYLKKVPLKKWHDKVFVIPNAGHVAQFENADEFNSVLNSICQSIL